MNILEFAIKMELEGEKYYLDQVEKNKENGLSTIFNLMAKDEHLHANVLQNKAEKINAKLNPSEALSNAKNIFDKLREAETQKIDIPSQVNAYREALDTEKESIDLYAKCLEEAEDEESKTLFKYLIIQEKEHYEILENMIALLNNADEWVESAEFGMREEY